MPKSKMTAEILISTAITAKSNKINYITIKHLYIII